MKRIPALTRITDSEGHPSLVASGDALLGSRADAVTAINYVEQTLDRSTNRAGEVACFRGQREAVAKLVAEDLAQKLFNFFIFYYMIWFLVGLATALMIRVFPEVGGRDRLLILIAANIGYTTFLIVLALGYELRQKSAWLTLPFLVIFAGWMYLFPYREQVMRNAPLVITVMFAATLPFAIGFFVRTEAGKRLVSRLKIVRKRNVAENSRRTEFVKQVEVSLRESGNILRHPFRLLRRSAVRSAAKLVYSLHTHPDCLDIKQAAEEFVKRHKFKDTMGRLATILGFVAALAYLVVPSEIGAEAAALAAASVLPVYAAAMFVMERIDEAREDALAEVLKLLK